MAQAALSTVSSGHYLIDGEMSFATVEQLLKDSHPFFATESSLLFDLSGVQHADSAGVALLVEWLRLAKQKQRQLHFRNIPAQMLAIIEVSDLEQRLPISDGIQKP